MEIASPRHNFDHPDRGLECEEALQNAFTRAIENATTAFIDLEHILAEISDDATRAGWERQEIIQAVLELGRLYMLKVKAPRHQGRSLSLASQQSRQSRATLEAYW
ncbi:hypothetical protein JJB09_25785 [Rhizobium sp. KVB221]|uniref:Uncharacterized protein n=1 Tax=Rhizobium setariae TaxID=2801340 RepID=A0A936YT90_9HYPH|nr:hypothetical protein [Rhizobium setariae]MBL0375423.1 hypothetical protein [Rhizobium setariae]